MTDTNVYSAKEQNSKMVAAPSLFERCHSIDTKHIVKKTFDKKGRFIPWPDMWVLLHKHFPDAQVDWPRFNNLPYLATPIGYFVYCSVTLEGITKTCELPVMGNGMNAVLEPDPRDINDNKMRAFVKACALHGLGISCWEKDDMLVNPKVSWQQQEQSGRPANATPLTSGTRQAPAATVRSTTPYTKTTRVESDTYARGGSRTISQSGPSPVQQPSSSHPPQKPLKSFSPND